METKRDTKRKETRKGKRTRKPARARENTTDLNRRPNRNIWCGPACATGWFDVKAAWADKGSNKGNEKGCEQTTTRETKEMKRDTEKDTKHNYIFNVLTMV